jgi:hypothetical protein
VALRRQLLMPAISNRTPHLHLRPVERLADGSCLQTEEAAYAWCLGMLIPTTAVARPGRGFRSTVIPTRLPMLKGDGGAHLWHLELLDRHNRALFKPTALA